MGIEQDLKSKLKSNQRTIFITDADDLLAAWRFKRQSSKKRSKNISMVPSKWRMSVPPNEKAPLKPCHVSIRRKAGQAFSKVEVGAPMDCHGHGMAKHLSISDLDALEAVSFAKRNIAPYVSPVLDTGTLALVCKDLGISGKAIPKVIKGHQYIAFSGHAGLRTTFPGTIYSAGNRKIITMAIGSLGLRSMVIRGGILTICLTVPLTVLEAFLSDHATCYDLAGRLASDVITVGVPALIGMLTGLSVGMFTTAVFWPIIVTIAAGAFAGIGFAALDENYRLTEKMTKIFEVMGEQIKQDAKNKIYDIETGLYNSIRAFFVEQGVQIGPY